MIKTVTLDGQEQMISELGGRNVLVINNSAAPVYASRNQNVSPYEDEVIEIQSESMDTVEGANGVVYLVGTGRVEVRGVDYVGFKKPSSSTSGGGGETGGVSKAYVDAQDTTTLGLAKKYTDSKVIALEPATETTLGGVKIGDGLDVEVDGKVSAPLATETKILEITGRKTASKEEVAELLSSIFNS